MEDSSMKKEKRAGSSGDEESGCRREEVSAVKVGEKRPYPENDDLKPSSSPGRKDFSSSNKQAAEKTDIERFSTEPDSMASSSSRREQKDELEFAKAEMREVREENQRLKMHLNRIMKDYQKLQMQFYDIVGQDHHAKKSPAADKNNLRSEAAIDQEPAEELVSLTLGISSSDSKKDDHKNKTSSSGAQGKILEEVKEGLHLGLDNYKKYEAPKSDVVDETLPNQISPANSSLEPKEEETWPPSKVLKTMRSDQDDEVLQQNSAKKPRVCVRARCDTPTMNDGCQWRKYGQKIAKGNPCPRAYYRCTLAPSCPVRKQVQRCAEDMSILITTYEGTHNHPLPMSATAMASTTSAAASMLLSGSSSSTSNNVPSSTAANITSNIPANLHGLNFYLSDNSKSKFYLPNSSLSVATSHPTITLDLTSSSSLSFPFNNRFSSAYNINTAPAKYPSTSGSNTLSFGSLDQSNTLSWSNGSLFSYGNGGSTQPYINMRNQIGALNIGRVPTTTNVESSNSIYQSFLMQKNINNHPPQQPADPIAAATKAITADPNFQSALAAALTSIIGNNNNCGATQTLALGDQRMAAKAQVLNKWGSDQLQPFPVSSSATASHSQTVKGNNNIGCASSFLKKSSTASTPSQPGSLMFLPPNSLPFSTAPESTSASPEDANHSN